MNFTEQNCVVTHNGRQFESGGAVVADSHLVGYLNGLDNRIGDRGEVTTWKQGEVIGRYVVTGRWRTPRSWISSHRISVRITSIDGRVYVGRSAGNNMFVAARRKK